ncbi:4'-phosphopantetheinyl transferase family protein [Paraburkholderia ferrariae]|uniref:4'-phosphopantetheinyl transferase family protein n=1 Tax=Paraburkholderia ferrariae TaxID=386056 RepID=UPI0009FBC2F2|nr:4'-phosphopantetheinyl transferase superfamily protein [Paraburkholderia ferrariae]
MTHRDTTARPPTQRAVLMAPRGRWPSGVDVWHVPVDHWGADENGSHLEPDERARALRYRHPADQARFAVTRSVLRELLGRYTGADPAALRFTSTARGKPILAAFPDLFFNVSHCGAHALIAVSGCTRVGIDIERVDADLRWHELLDLVCTAAERAAIEAAPLAARADLFLRCWTAKEALLKAVGLGITEGLLKLTVDLGGHAHAPARPEVADDPLVEEARRLRYCWIDDLPGYTGCLAYAFAGAPQDLPRA